MKDKNSCGSKMAPKKPAKKAAAKKGFKPFGKKK